MKHYIQLVALADVMVSKMDSCMVDLVDFHQRAADKREAEPARQQSVPEAQGTEEEKFYEPASRIDTAKSAESIYYDSTDAELNDTQQGSMERQPSQGFEFQQRRKQQEGGILAALRRSFG